MAEYTTEHVACDACSNDLTGSETYWHLDGKDFCGESCARRFYEARIDRVLAKKRGDIADEPGVIGRSNQGWVA